MLVSIFYILFIWPRISVKKKIQKNRTRIEELRDLLNEVAQADKPFYLPKKFINEYALLKLESYFVNNRVDTLKEAINLFQKEKIYDNKMKELNTIKEIQKKLCK